ncbi:transcriptional regulator [Desulfuromonas versatilis]|uniref:Transcriptional regulator n=2 Tax=Desulfuromonas versatilis TaxID=2802975 RepID=A0ABM9SDC2_9BACT|nr:transcriptional regulator [Desulfuromonas versatilis]
MPAKMKLTHVDLLRLFDSPEYAEIAKGFKEQRYAKKTIVCTPYDEGNRLFIVKSGRLRVFLSYEDREFTLALLEPGDIFSTHTRAFAEALEESVVLLGNTLQFQQKIVESPEITLVMVKVLGELLKNSITIIEGLAFKDARQRLLDFLVSATEDRGQLHPEGVSVELGLTTEEIALLVGTTRQTISTLLNDLIKSEVLEKLDRRTLLIRDIALLQDWNSLS